MKEIPRIAETEWKVMKIIWSDAPVTANDVIEKLSGDVSWKPKTVKTLLSRLLNKNIISYEKEGRIYKYYPIFTEEQCVKIERKSFLDRIYNGGFKEMLLNFIEDENLSTEDIEDLKQILDCKKDR
jgi:BlaI family penicillinase repressor